MHYETKTSSEWLRHILTEMKASPRGSGTWSDRQSTQTDKLKVFKLSN